LRCVLIGGWIQVYYDFTEWKRSQKSTKKYGKRRRKFTATSLEDMPPPYPQGWYCLLYSRELAKNEVKAVVACGVNLCVWRDEKGKVTVMDAYCPHLGADLTFGKVVNRRLVCPFHGWAFDSAGEAISHEQGVNCSGALGTSVPYECQEINQMIIVWLSGDRKKRSIFQIPVESCLDDYEYTGIVEHKIMAHIQEIPENGADIGHLSTVHGKFVIECLTGILDHSWLFSWTPGQTIDDRHQAVVTMELGTKLFGTIIHLFDIHVYVRQIGPALVHEYLTLPLGMGTVYFVSTLRPEGPLCQHYSHAMWHPKWMPRFVAKNLLRGLAKQVNRDIPIWSSKTFVKHPRYTKVDSNIPKFRRWYKQFYTSDCLSFEEALEKEKTTSIEW